MVIALFIHACINKAVRVICWSITSQLRKEVNDIYLLRERMIKIQFVFLIIPERCEVTA